MILVTIHLNKDYINSFFYDALSLGKSQYTSNGEKYTANLSNEEYDSFMKDNNLIPYKNLLKLYEIGEIVGSFQIEDE